MGSSSSRGAPLPPVLGRGRGRGRTPPAPRTATPARTPARVSAEPKFPHPLRLLRPRAPVLRGPHVLHHALHPPRPALQRLVVILQGGDATGDAGGLPVRSHDDPLHVALEVPHPPREVAIVSPPPALGGTGPTRPGRRSGTVGVTGGTVRERTADVLQVRPHRGVQRGEPVRESIDVWPYGVHLDHSRLGIGRGPHGDVGDLRDPSFGDRELLLEPRDPVLELRHLQGGGSELVGGSARGGPGGGRSESPPFMRRASWSRRMSAKPSMARRTDGVTLYQSLSPTTRSRMFMKASTEGGRVLPSSRANDISAGLVKTNNRFSGGSSSGGCSRRSRTRSRGCDGQTWLPRDAKDGDTREPCDPSAVR